jgi:hypothetical protein
LALLFLAAAPAAGQSLSDVVGQAAGTKDVPDSAIVAHQPAPWPVVTGQLVVGTALAAAAGFGAGTLAEAFCDDCDGGRPGGDSAGLLAGVPVGALIGTWFVGKLAPPSGRFADTAFGALAGTAVFAGYIQILEGQSDGLRWTGVIFPAALAAMGWNRSRPIVEPQVAIHQSLDPATRTLTAELLVFRLRF